MFRAGLPYVVSLTVALIGAVTFTVLEWPAFTFYIVLVVAIVAYFTALDFVDGHPRHRTGRP